MRSTGQGWVRLGQRTKTALAALKARGAELGNRTNRGGSGRPRARHQRCEGGGVPRDKMVPIIDGYRSHGLTMAAVAAELNLRSIKTAHGAEWHQPTISRLLKAAHQRVAADGH